MIPETELRHDEINKHDFIWLKSDSGGWDGPHREFPVMKEMWLNAVSGRKLAVQAGGCCGMYPRLMSDIFETVYTFEPDVNNYYCLEQNCKDKENIHYYNAALGAIIGSAEMELCGDGNVGMHKAFLSEKGTVQQYTIDSFDLPACDLIQLDVEGYESYILQGAIKTIKKYWPAISVENSNDKINQILTPYGYKDVDRKHSDTIWKKSF